jgi:putative tricarboxylic transport membrane protein
VIEGLTNAFLQLLVWPVPLFIVLGIALGLLFGILPGVGGTTALALLLPITFGMDADLALIFLMTAYSVAGFGGMITSILLNVPGDAPNAATTLDGYPMAKEGRAPEAIGAATVASVVGGIIGIAFLIAVTPIARTLILSFSYPEFFMIAIAGLAGIAAFTRGQTHKGLIAAGIGLLISFIGLDPVTGSPRFDFGQLYLWDGIDIVPALVGLFAGAEMVYLYGKGTPIAERADVSTTSTSTFLQGAKANLRHWSLVLRSSIIGIIVGVIPGIGGTVASFFAYGQAAQTSKTPERFGKGAVEGVIASESANDADKGGALLPTMAFGIPGGVGMAILLGALLLHGVPAGPNLLRDHIDIVYVLIVAAVVPRTIAGFIVWAIGARALWFTSIRSNLLVPLIITIALVGIYAVRSQILDVLVAIVFGYLGYSMSKYGFSRVALIIGLVLGPLIEASYQQTISAYGGVSAFFTRPISLAFFILTVASLVIPPILARRRRGSGPASSVGS